MTKKGRPIGTGTGPARELTTPEIERLTKCTSSPRDLALIWLCLGGGLRIGEACSMTRARLGSDGSVLVEASLAKSGRSRRCYLTPQATRHLKVYLDSRKDDTSEALFPSRSGGGCMTANWGVRLVERLLEEAGIVGASSHSLRRTHANTCRRNGIDITIISSQLGHSSLSTTAMYLSSSAVEKSAALNRIKF